MKTITIQKQLFKFDELSNEVKDKLIESERQHFWEWRTQDECEFIVSDINEQLKEIKFGNLKVKYWNFESRGDGGGIGFEGEIFLGRFIKVFKLHRKLKMSNIQHKLGTYISVGCKDRRGWSENSNIDLEDLGERKTEKQEELIEKLRVYILKYLEDLGDKFYKGGVEQLEYCVSDGVISDNLREHEFESDGVIYA